MSYPLTQSPRQNDILAALPLMDYAGMADALEPVELLSGQVIDEPGSVHGFVYFPVTCTVSLVSSTQDGEMSELAITGHEGLVGVACVLGMPSVSHRSMVMQAGQAYRMPVHDFDLAVAQSAMLRRLTLRYVQALMSQMAQSIVCSRHHSVLQRLSFWLLFNQDRSDTDQLKVTHETVAHMLGVRRESITQAAGQLQSSGWIRTSRGKIYIEDAQGLSSRACECYGLVKAEYARLHEPLLNASSVSVAWAAQEQGAQAHLVQTDHGSEPLSDERKYADIYDFAPVGLLSVDPQGRLLEINMAGAILLGIQRSRSSSHVFTEFLSEEAQDTFLAFHAEVLSGKCRRHCELALKPTAQRPEVVVRIDATVDEDGLENRMVMSDITEQVQQAQALAAREREQRALLEHLPGVFWIKDELGRFVAVNHLDPRHGSDAAGSASAPMPAGDGHMHFAAGRAPDAARAAGFGN
jgi:CRP-like cAMP-binding protein